MEAKEPLSMLKIKYDEQVEKDYWQLRKIANLKNIQKRQFEDSEELEEDDDDDEDQDDYYFEKDSSEDEKEKKEHEYWYSRKLEKFKADERRSKSQIREETPKND